MTYLAQTQAIAGLSASNEDDQRPGSVSMWSSHLAHGSRADALATFHPRLNVPLRVVVNKAGRLQ
jgi:hypothetical protein